MRSAESRAFASRYALPSRIFPSRVRTCGVNGLVSPSKKGAATRARSPARIL